MEVGTTNGYDLIGFLLTLSLTYFIVTLSFSKSGRNTQLLTVTENYYVYFTENYPVYISDTQLFYTNICFLIRPAVFGLEGTLYFADD